MKKAVAIFLCLFVLSGCRAKGSVDHAVSLRNQVVSADSCAFDSLITADYSDRIYTFSMHCIFDKSGDMAFTVLEPETISDISGRVDGKGGKITFDDQALLFDLMADGYLSPVSAPWIFMKTLRAGYLSSYEAWEDGGCITIDDSYEGKPLTVQVWTDKNNTPFRAELLWEGRRVLSLSVTNFFCV